MVPPVDHDCPLTEMVKEQQKRIDELLSRAEKQNREIAPAEQLLAVFWID